MKSFYEFYRRIQANKLFEQVPPGNPSMSMPPMAGQTGGGMPSAPSLGGMGSMPPGGGMPTGGGMSPQGFMDEGPMTAGQEEGVPAPEEGAEGQENVDASVGADAEGPEAVMQKAVSDIESQLDFLRSKGEDSAARADTISDLLKMVKKNIEKAEGGSEEEGMEGGEEAPPGGEGEGAMGQEGPPIGDQAVPSFGGNQDMAGMSNAGMSQMPMPGGGGMAAESFNPTPKRRKKKR